MDTKRPQIMTQHFFDVAEEGRDCGQPFSTETLPTFQTLSVNSHEFTYYAAKFTVNTKGHFLKVSFI